ncbi:MAG: uroporphyrinogen-III synthase [Azospirillaceae bacterium]|nr:uroporphyrinogen-III synthase [Azospirillaceae bacterium]
MATVLITRPRPQADETAAHIVALGHTPLIDPLMSVAPVDAVLPPADDVQAYLVTSVNGVRALVRLGAARTRPVYAVGDRSAAAARDVGFMDVHSAGGDAEDLARLVVARARPDDGLLLHAAGADVAGDPAAALGAQGFSARRLTVYRAVAATALLPDVCDALAAGLVERVLLFSPRSARTFVNLAVQDGVSAPLAGVVALCLSPAVAGALAGDAGLFGGVAVAAQPNQAALLDLLTVDAPGP